MELFAFHNSRELFFRSPHGALACRRTAVLRLALSGADAHGAAAFLRLWSDGRETVIPGEPGVPPAIPEKNPSRSIPNARGSQNLYFSFHITAPETPQLIWYYFIIEANGERLYYGARTGMGRLYGSIPPDYQITVFEPDFETPKWFREGIVYQIFPDRFARGPHDASGCGGLARTAYHERLGRRVFRHNDWNEAVLFRPLPGEKHYSPCDFYGGDLRGIVEKLPYLRSLGVTVIYLNPIFESPSNHRYNTSDYLSVDPVLGGNEALSELSEAAADCGITLMLDGVFSHTGDDSVYFNKYGRYQAPGAYSGNESPYYEWYDFRSFPDDYTGWWGFKTLPEVRELTPSYIEFVRSVLRHWAGFGIKAWRLDVADELPDEFIAILRSELKSLFPDALLLGEVWEDASNKEWAEGLRKYVYGHELDAVMNYPFRDAVCDFLCGRIDAFELNERLAGQRERYPAPFYGACMNLLGSHDTYRILSELGGAPAKDTLTREQQVLFTLSDAALAAAKRRLMLASALQFSMPQPPCIYYGDEAGMTGLSDPFNRAAYPWGREDAELIAHYRRLGGLRSGIPALGHGLAAFFAADESVFSVYRRSGPCSAITLLNRSDETRSIVIAASDFSEGPNSADVVFAPRYTDALGSGLEADVWDGRLTLSLPPLTALILVSAV